MSKSLRAGTAIASTAVAPQLSGSALAILFIARFTGAAHTP